MKKLAVMLLLLACVCTGAGAMEIPPDIREIESEAFCGLSDVYALDVPEGVVRIDARAFADSSLFRVSLPASLEYISDDAFAGCEGLLISAPYESYAWNWACENGYADRTPFLLHSGKDMASFDEAFRMVVTDCTPEWSGTGKIRYVEQFGASRTYVPEYWKSKSDAAGSCTRAAGSMAASYMGINILPKASADFTQFQARMQTLGCTVAKRTDCALEGFTAWYNDYAGDETGKYSPVVLYTNYGSSQHAIVVIGRDKTQHDCFYVADSGTSSVIGRIRLFVDNGRVYVDEYVKSSGAVDTRYSREHSMIYMWRYVKK